MVKRKASTDPVGEVTKKKAVDTAPLPSFLSGNDEATTMLPRGKTAVDATPKVVQAPKAISEDKGLFSMTRAKKEKRTESNAAAGDDADDMKDDENVVALKKAVKAAVSDKDLKNVYQLRIKGLGVGNVLLGAVKAITELDMVVSLPDGLTGFVSLREVSDAMANVVDTYISESEKGETTLSLPALADLYKIGSLVRVVIVNITSTEKNRRTDSRIELSMRPSLINTYLSVDQLKKNNVLCSAVLSVQSKGYILETGIQGVTAFLPKNEVKGTALQVGYTQDVQLTATPSPDSRVLNVTCNVVHEKAVLGMNSDFSINSLKPGTLVQTSVMNHLVDGLQVRLLGDMVGTVSIAHLNKPMMSAVYNLENLYDLNKMYTARVLFVNSGTKQIILTYREDIVSQNIGTSYDDANVTIGKVLKAVPILRTIGDHAVVLQLNSVLSTSSKTPVLAYLPRHEVSDEPLESLPKNIKTGKTMDIRVTGINAMEGFVVVTAKPSVVKSDVYKLDDIEIGKMYDVTVIDVKDKIGLFVSITSTLSGLVPLSHLRDTALTASSKIADKFAVGKKLKLRALNMDLEKDLLAFTAKPALLKDDVVVVSTYEQVETALNNNQTLIAEATVTEVNERFVKVAFFGAVRGFCHISDMINTGVIVEGQKPTDAYQVGQTVKVKAVKLKEKNQLVVSFNLSKTGGKKTAVPSVPVGSWVSAQVVGADAAKKVLNVEIMYNDKKFDAVLPQHLLSNTPSHTAVLFEYYAETKPLLPLALVFGRTNEKLSITIQPLQLAHAANLDCSEFIKSISSSTLYEFNNQFTKALAKNGAQANNLASNMINQNQNVSVGDFYFLNVSKVEDYGIYARGMGNVVVFLTKAELSDGFVENVHNVVKVGETIGAVITKKIESVDDKNNDVVRLEGSMKPASTQKLIAKYDQVFTLATLAEQRFVQETVGFVAVEGEKQPFVAAFVPIGTIFPDTQVSSVQGNTVTLKSKANSSAVLTVLNSYHISGSSIKDGAVKGANVSSRVIYNNPVNGNAVVSCKPAVIDGILSSMKQRKEYAGLACASSAMGVTCGSSVNVEVLHVDGANVIVGLVDYKYTLAYALSRSINVNSSFYSMLVPGYKLKATVLSNSANVNTPLIVKLDFTASKSSRFVLPDGTFYSVSTIQDLDVGSVVKVKLGKYDERIHAYPVSFGPDSAYSDIVKGTLSLSSIMDVDMSVFKKKKIPEMSVFSTVDKIISEDSLVNAKIVHKVVSKNDVVVPGMKRGMKQLLVSVSIRPSDIEGDNYTQRYSIDEYTEDSTQIGTITSVTPSKIICEFAPKMFTTIRSTGISSNEEYLNNLENYIKVGDVTRVKVKFNSTLDSKAETKKIRLVSALVHTKLNPTGVDSNTNFDAVDQGQITIGDVVENVVVTRYNTESCDYTVSFPSFKKCVGKLLFAELNDNFPVKTNIFNIGDVIPRVAVIGRVDENVYTLSLRDSRVEQAEQGTLDVPTDIYNRRAPQEASTVESFDPLQVANVLTFKTVAAGQLLKGYITSVNKTGVYVQLSAFLVGRILLKNLSSTFISNPETKFKLGQLIPVRVLSTDNEKASIDLTAKPSLVSNTNMRVLETLQPGMVVKGTVQNVTDNGVFISLKNCDLTVLSRKNQCVDNKSIDFRTHYNAGDKVKAVVIAVDKAQQKIAVGLKASLFTKLEQIKANAESIMSDTTSIDKDEEFLSKVFESDDEEDDMNDDDSASEESDDDNDNVVTPVQARNAVVESQIESAPSLFSALVFNNHTDAGNNDDEEEELVPMFDDDDDWLQQNKQRKEAEIERAERAMMDDNVPQSSDDFEMQCVRTPNNSYIWVQYMAYELTQGNINKAREIADRALKAISVHSSQERWNIWSALLSLENVYGTEVSMGETVKRAQKLNNPLTVQLELARIYELSNKVDKASDTYLAASKKYGSDLSAHAVDIWTKWFTVLFVNNRVDEARKVLASAIQKLNTKQHPSVIIKFAQLEFHNKHGNAERARMLLEQFLVNNSKRLDVWIVYVDQELKLTRTLLAQVNGKPGDAKKAKNRVRALYDRITAESYWKLWTTKQMKFIFKKYIDFEDEFGSASRVSTVQDRARLYVSSVTVE